MIELDHFVSAKTGSGLLGSRCRSYVAGVLDLWIVGVSSMWQVSMDGQQGERRPQNESVG